MTQCAKQRPGSVKPRHTSPAYSASYLSSRAAFFITTGFIASNTLKYARKSSPGGAVSPVERWLLYPYLNGIASDLMQVEESFR